MRKIDLFTASPVSAMTLLETARRVDGHLGGYRAASVGLVLLGTMAAVAESVGITLVVLFVYASLGQLEGLGFFSTLMHADPFGLGSLAELGEPAIAAAIVVAIVLKSAISVANALLANKIRHDIQYETRERLFEALLAKPYLDLSRHDRGELHSILAVEAYALAGAHYSLVRIGVNIGSTIIFGLFLILTSWQVAVIVAVGAVLHGQLSRLLAARVTRYGADKAMSIKSLNLMIYVTLQGMRTVLTFGREGVLRDRHRALLADAEDVARRADALGYLVQPVSELFTLGLLSLVLILSGPLGIPFAGVLSSLVLIYRLQPHLRELDSNRLALDGIRPSLDIIEGFLKSDPTLAKADGRLPFEKLRTGITFQAVSMVYPSFTRASLDAATFTIPAGKRTAILGPSGAGKSTVASLILKLFRPTSGAILVDGVPLDEIRRADWLERVAFAGQDAELVEGTIRDNIAFVREDAEAARIEAAITDAGISDFVSQLPHGFDEWLGDAGFAVSGGQRQRIGLARAFIRDPEILILDEATSALDVALAARIRNAIWRRFGDRTVILITHDLDVVPEVDHVICLTDDGRIAEAGPPRDLLADPASSLSRMTDPDRRTGADT